jgi:hypothetical protein
VTHIFDSTSEYLDSDTVFAVKDALIVDFAIQQAQNEDAKRLGIEPPYAAGAFDFVLTPAM